MPFQLPVYSQLSPNAIQSSERHELFNIEKLFFGHHMQLLVFHENLCNHKLEQKKKQENGCSALLGN